MGKEGRESHVAYTLTILQVSDWSLLIADRQQKWPSIFSGKPRLHSLVFRKLLGWRFGSWCSSAPAAATTSHRFHRIATGSSFRHNLVRHRTRSCSTFNSHIWLIVTAQMEAAVNLPFKNLPQVRLLPLWVISLLQLPWGPAKNHYPPHPRTHCKRSWCFAIIFALTTRNPQIPPGFSVCPVWCWRRNLSQLSLKRLLLCGNTSVSRLLPWWLGRKKKHNKIIK